MRKQQQIWQNEHLHSGSLPSMASDRPSSAVVEFIKFIQRQRNNSFKVIDIGCGKGRNSIFLAEQGYEVYAVDYIQEALNKVKERAERAYVENKVRFLNAEIDKPWPFPNNFFDVAIDCFSSIDIETKKGREIYKDQMYRTLKPGGYAFVSVVSVNDEWEKQLIATSPGDEKNSTIWPQNKKFQKDYDEEELRRFYKLFKIVSLKEVQKKAFKLNKEYIATNYVLTLKK